MQAKNFALAAVLTAVFAGNAFAFEPASGEGPLFPSEPVAASTVSRAEVIKQAIATPPASGVGEIVNAKPEASTSQYTRAEVRQQTRDAIANGYRVRSGELP